MFIHNIKLYYSLCYNGHIICIRIVLSIFSVSEKCTFYGHT